MSESSLAPKKSKRSILQVLYTTAFFLATSSAFVTYFNSSFLKTIIDEKYIGLVYALSYAVAIVVMAYYGKLITKFHNHLVLLTTLLIQIVALIWLSSNLFPAASLVAFIIYITCINIIVINFDIFLESVSTASNTGRVRGIFLTVFSLGFVLSQMLVGSLVETYGFWIAYLGAGLMLIPVWVMIFFTYRNGAEPHYKKHKPLIKILRRIIKSKDLRGIFLTAMALYLFYSWMVIYTPLHLLELGFSWEQLGFIFTVMLLPFVLIQFPAGYIADKYLGEKEMLTMGLCIMAIAVFLLIYVTQFWAIVAVLFLSRIGASLVEVMRDSYFYKQVEADDLDLIEEFRITGPISYMIGPLLASALLALGLGLTDLFLVLGGVLIVSCAFPLMIKDTK